MRLTRVKIHPVYRQTDRNITELTVNHALGVGSQLNPTISGVGEVGFSHAPSGGTLNFVVLKYFEY